MLISKCYAVAEHAAYRDFHGADKVRQGDQAQDKGLAAPEREELANKVPRAFRRVADLLYLGVLSFFRSRLARSIFEYPRIGVRRLF